MTPEVSSAIQASRSKFSALIWGLLDYLSSLATIETTPMFDRWQGLRNGRPFPERAFIDKMYVAHDLVNVSSVRLERERGVLPLDT